MAQGIQTYLDDKEFVKTMNQTRPAGGAAARDMSAPPAPIGRHRAMTEKTEGEVAKDLRKRKKFDEENKLYTQRYPGE